MKNTDHQKVYMSIFIEDDDIVIKVSKQITKLSSSVRTMNHQKGISKSDYYVSFYCVFSQKYSLQK